jgi:predicted nucleic-acid-binding protein
MESVTGPRRLRHGRADFADYLIAERAIAAGCERVATFDGRLREEAGFTAP